MKKDWKTLWELINIEENEEAFKEFFNECFIDTHGLGYEVDLYAYINDEGTGVYFDTFTNVGGNSWLDDDHFTIHRFIPCYWPLNYDFCSNKEFVDYMQDVYSVAIDLDGFTYGDGDIDYDEATDYIIREYPDTCEKAWQDLAEETGSAYLEYESMIEYIQDKVREEEIEEKYDY